MRQHLLTALLAVSAVLFAFPSLAQAPAGPPEWWYWHHGGFGWSHIIFGMLMMIVFWGGLILLLVLAVRWLGRGSVVGSPPAGHRTPGEILEERFARGEIDKAEFEGRKRALSK